MMEKQLKAESLVQKALNLARVNQDERAEERAFAVLQQIRPQLAAPPQAPARMDMVQEQIATPLVKEVKESQGLDFKVVQEMVKSTLLASIGSDEAVDMDTPLMEAGMDSLSMVAFRNQLQKESGIKMPSSIMFDYPTMSGLVSHLVEASKGS